MSDFFLFKSIHIIGFVSWFAALFYLPRLFIYHTEAFDAPEPKRFILLEQFKIMEGRLYRIIMTPAMCITFFGGFSMVYLRGWDWWSSNIWMHWKILFILLLVVYHFYCQRIMQRLAQEERVMTSTQFRFFNEITTLFLLAIVLLAVYKNTLSFIYAFLGILGVGILLAIGVRAYKKIPEKADN